MYDIVERHKVPIFACVSQWLLDDVARIVGDYECDEENMALISRTEAATMLDRPSKLPHDIYWHLNKYRPIIFVTWQLISSRAYVDHLEYCGNQTYVHERMCIVNGRKYGHLKGGSWEGRGNPVFINTADAIGVLPANLYERFYCKREPPDVNTISGPI